MGKHGLMDYMDCTTMKKPPFQILLDYSIPSLVVSPELYGIIIVWTPPPFCLGWRRVEPPTKF